MRAMSKSEERIMRPYLVEVEKWKERLALNEEPFDDIDPYMLIRVLTWKRPKSLPSDVSKILKDAEIPISDELEFIGDAVIHLIFTNLVHEQRLNVHQMTHYRSELERNTNLYEYGQTTGLCRHIQRDKIKPCADIFEALIGALYIHLFYQKHLGYGSLEYISNWIDNFEPEALLEELIAEERY
jgi:hypothetical protein